MTITKLSAHIDCLAHLQQKITLLKKLNSLWQQLVPENLHEHTQVANYRDGYLIIEIDNASWATFLRFAIPELTKKLRNFPVLSNLKTIEWYTHLHKIQPTIPTPVIPLVSKKNAMLIKEVANSLTHAQLKSSLEHLATHNVLSEKKP